MPVIGIDLGTSYSCVALLHQGKVEVIENELGKRKTPSCVAFTDTEAVIGEVALNQASMNWKNTVLCVKRLIGRNTNDPSLILEQNYWPFELDTTGNQPRIVVQYKNETRKLFAEEISAILLTNLKTSVEEHLGMPISDAVISVPNYFNDQQRQATRDAGRIAGLNVLGLINDSTAAALTYAVRRKPDAPRHNVLIFDVGGGTMSASIVAIGNGALNVLATGGDTRLGGVDFDIRLMERCLLNECVENCGRVWADKHALLRLQLASEQARHKLGLSSKTYVEINSLFQGTDLCCNVDREHFDGLTRGLCDRALVCVKKVLDDAQMNEANVQEVLLVGGCSRIPQLQQILKAYFGGKPFNKSVNADEAVAIGAAIRAGMLSGESNANSRSIQLKEVAAHTLEVPELGLNIVKHNGEIPVWQEKSLSISATTYTMHLKENDQCTRTFFIEGIRPARDAQYNLRLRFDVGVDGIFNVSAFDICGGQELRVSKLGNRTANDIERMKQWTESLNSDVMHERDRTAAMNAVEDLVISASRNVSNRNSSQENVNFIDDVKNGVLSWVSGHRNATKKEFEEKLKEIEQLISSFTAQNAN